MWYKVQGAKSKTPVGTGQHATIVFAVQYTKRSYMAAGEQPLRINTERVPVTQEPPSRPLARRPREALLSEAIAGGS